MNTIWSLVTSNWKLLVLAWVLVGLVALTLSFALWATVLRVRNVRKAKRWDELEEKWEALLPEVMAGLTPDSVLRSRIRKAEQLYFVDFLYKTALRAGPGRREALPRFALPFLGPIVRRMEGGDAERRARAVQTVAVLDLDRNAARVLKALDDPSPLVSMIAARNLAASGRPDLVTAVMERLDRFQEWSPKFLISMLVSMGSESAVLIRAALSSPLLQPQVRAVCADALAQLGVGEALPEAIGVLSTETDADLLSAALRLVRAIGGASALESVRALSGSADFAVRAQAIATLGQLGNEEDLARLKVALRDPSPWVALHAARGLRAHGQLQYLRNALHAGTVSSDVALQVLAE